MLHFLILSGWLSVYITSALTTMDGGDLKRQELIKTAIRQSDVPNVSLVIARKWFWKCSG